MHDENLNARSFAKRGAFKHILVVFSCLNRVFQPLRERIDYPQRSATRYSATLAKQIKCSQAIFCPITFPQPTYVHLFSSF